MSSSTTGAKTDHGMLRSLIEAYLLRSGFVRMQNDPDRWAHERMGNNRSFEDALSQQMGWEGPWNAPLPPVCLMDDTCGLGPHEARAHPCGQTSVARRG